MPTKPETAKASWYNPSATDVEPPIGGFVFATAMAAPKDQGITWNRDMLPGPKNPSDPPWIWAVRITKAGSNGYYHEPKWIQFKESHGEACFSVTLSLAEAENRTITIVRVESQKIAEEKGPDAYGPSR